MSQGDAGRPGAEPLCERAGTYYGRSHDYIQISMANGYMDGYKAATAVCGLHTVLAIVDYSMLGSDVLGGWIMDGVNFLCLEGLLYSILPALGALVWTASPSSCRNCQETRADEEMGFLEKH